MSANMLPAEKLFLNEDFSDIELKVQSCDGYVWRFCAHSAFLRSGSEWMRDRIDELRLHGDGNNITTMTFVDISPDTFLLLLRYLYMGKLPTFLHIEVIIELLACSVRFQMPSLKAECEKRIIRSIRVLNVGHLLERVTDLEVSGRGSASLIDACRRLLLRYGQIIFSSDLVQQLSQQNLEYIVASPNLNVVSEKVVFDGVWSWGKKRCCRNGLPLTDQNVIDTLGDILQHVRFSSLKSADLPRKVRERFCSSDKPRLCCTNGSEEHGQCRCTYKQPADLLHQSSRKLISAYVPPNPVKSTVEAPPLDSRLLCAQISFSSSVYITAVGLDAFPIESSDSEIFILTITSENSGNEVCRESMNAWNEYVQTEETSDQKLLSTVHRLSKPLEIEGRSQYSFHLLREEKKDVEENGVDEIDSSKKWMFPVTSVRRNISPPDDDECHMINHNDRIVSITAIYFIPGVGQIW